MLVRLCSYSYLQAEELCVVWVPHIRYVFYALFFQCQTPLFSRDLGCLRELGMNACVYTMACHLTLWAGGKSLADEEESRTEFRTNI
ncbi:hypothetical protein SeMB42_g04145 [Synchytrium endobioticum]|uniref:Uncharacterized protein n=1 Tax=Synchytrium endobioticum TaxID=286115 RepID=A0A507D0L4_9FUNG|nr:hypothetical protein SeMB42_g04145 [Synchytrium endobioticum]